VINVVKNLKIIFGHLFALFVIMIYVINVLKISIRKKIFIYINLFKIILFEKLVIKLDIIFKFKKIKNKKFFIYN